MSAAVKTRRYTKRIPRQERREQLLDASIELIARDGWAALRINRVADEAKIAKSVIYSIFGSMEGLQQAVMRREQQRAFELSEQALATARSEVDPLRAISRGLEAFLAGVAKEPVTWRLVLIPADNTPVSVRMAILEGRERWRREIEALLGNLLDDTEPDVELVSHIVRDNIESLARLIIEDPDRFTPERVTERATRLAARLL